MLPNEFKVAFTLRAKNLRIGKAGSNGEWRSACYGQRPELGMREIVLASFNHLCRNIAKRIQIDCHSRPAARNMK